jgi:hypothetical protein
MSPLRDFWNNVVGPSRLPAEGDTEGAPVPLGEGDGDNDPAAQAGASSAPVLLGEGDGDNGSGAQGGASKGPVLLGEYNGDNDPSSAQPATAADDNESDNTEDGGAVEAEAWEGSRGLTASERSAAQGVYQDAIDYDKVAIIAGSLGSAGAPARTIGNSIYMADEQFVQGTSDLTPGGMTTLIHELGHVWQYQTAGAGYIPNALGAQLGAWLTTGDRGNAYNWRAAIDQRVPWEDWNAEQQAEAMEAYYEATQRIAAGQPLADDQETVRMLQPYVGKLRTGQGAPKLPEVRTGPTLFDD